jgi:hypothetical protein
LGTKVLKNEKPGCNQANQINHITMTEAKLIENPLNPNLEAFRKEMRLTNVAVYPEMLIYKLPTRKLAEGCIPMALDTILKHSLPLDVVKPSGIANTFIVKPKSPNNENSHHPRSNRAGNPSHLNHQNDSVEPQNVIQMNHYIPFDSETADLEQAYLNDMKAERLRFAELDRIGNTFERISEQLSVLHSVLNQPAEMEVSHAR